MVLEEALPVLALDLEPWSLEASAPGQNSMGRASDPCPSTSSDLHQAASRGNPRDALKDRDT